MCSRCKVILGEMASLHCIYDMEGEELYSVKWYKVSRGWHYTDIYNELSQNGHEFFRYIPRDREQRITTFNLPGIKVDYWRVSSYCMFHWLLPSKHLT